MTEYIIEWSGIGARIVELVGSVPTCLITKRIREERRREEIVRCRDCRFALAYGNGCGRNQDIYDVEPDGYCAWGEKKEKEAVEVWQPASEYDVTCYETGDCDE